jgi:hypothetical protein
MNSTCLDDGYGRFSEFVTYDTCHVHLIADKVLKGIVVAVGLIALTVQMFHMIMRRESVKAKGPYTKTLIYWTTIQNLVMILRPLVGLITQKTSETAIYMGFISHISAIGAADLVVLTIYIETNILERSALRRHQTCLTKHRAIVLLTVAIVQSLLFLTGPIVTIFIRDVAHYMFWAPVMVVDFTVIPYFCLSGIIIYRKVQKMQKENYRKISHHILLTIVICSAIGLFTGGAGAYLMTKSPYEWVLVEACWLSDIGFNLLMFFFMGKKQIKKPSNNTPVISNSSTGSRSTNSIEIQHVDEKVDQVARAIKTPNNSMENNMEVTPTVTYSTNANSSTLGSASVSGI